jgi:DNA-binding GntR family transcriptional regulator
MAQLQADYSAANGTVMNAIRKLEEEGRVTGRTGSGSYING